MLRIPSKLTLLVFLLLFALATACSPASDETAIVEAQWDQPPELTIDTTKIYLATLETEKGDIRIELFAQQTPITVNNFIFLANAGFYNNTTFHRVLPNFMAQGGDPEGTGAGGPGYDFQDEFVPELTFDDAGYLAMANGGAKYEWEPILYYVWSDTAP